MTQCAHDTTTLAPHGGVPFGSALLPTADYRDAAHRHRLGGIVARVRGEFREMPGLSPTLTQAARLFGLTLQECSVTLTSLTIDGFLTQGTDGRYRIA